MLARLLEGIAAAAVVMAAVGVYSLILIATAAAVERAAEED